MNVGDKVIDVSSFDGAGTILEVRRSSGVYASGQLRPGTQTRAALVEFERTPRVGLRLMHGHVEKFRRWIPICNLVPYEETKK
jgi:hypothetical protein